MATHDYVIDNGTGAAVRTDLNNALAAIVSNNSSASEPSTKYAYQWWADTNTGILKIRNSANNGWVELLQLDGTLTMEDGTASAPGLAFRDDLDTGIFSGEANRLSVTVGGTERLQVGSTDIQLISANDIFLKVQGSESGIDILGDSTVNLYFNGALTFNTDAFGTVNRGRVLSSGDNDPFHGERYTANANGPLIFLNKSRNATVFQHTIVQADDTLGGLLFRGSDGDSFENAALVLAAVDGTPSAGTDMPGRIVMMTCADGTNTLAEHFRLTSSGRFGLGTGGPVRQVDIVNTNGEAQIRPSDGNSGEARLFIGGGGSNQNKCAIIFDPDGGFCRGNLKFCIEGTGDTSNVDSSNVAFQIESTRKINMSFGSHFFAINNGDSPASNAPIILKNTSNNTLVTVVKFEGYNASETGSIRTHVNATQFNTSSDYRLKENQVAISDGITRMKQLKPYRFNFKEVPDTTVDGFFAHEVASVVPNAVSGEKDEMAREYYEDGDTIPSGKKIGDYKGLSTTKIQPQGIDHSKLVPLLVACCQELITKVEALEAG